MRRRVACCLALLAVAAAAADEPAQGGAAAVAEPEIDPEPEAPVAEEEATEAPEDAAEAPPPVAVDVEVTGEAAVEPAPANETNATNATIKTPGVSMARQQRASLAARGPARGRTGSLGRLGAGTRSAPPPLGVQSPSLAARGPARGRTGSLGRPAGSRRRSAPGTISAPVRSAARRCRTSRRATSKKRPSRRRSSTTRQWTRARSCWRVRPRPRASAICCSTTRTSPDARAGMRRGAAAAGDADLPRTELRSSAGTASRSAASASSSSSVCRRTSGSRSWCCASTKSPRAASVSRPMLAAPDRGRSGAVGNERDPQVLVDGQRL